MPSEKRPEISRLSLPKWCASATMPSDNKPCPRRWVSAVGQITWLMENPLLEKGFLE